MQQLSINFAKAQRDTILDRTERKVSPAFIDMACKAAVGYLTTCTNFVSSGELITQAIKLKGIRSTDDRHFGVVFRKLIKQGHIRKIDSCKRMRGHGTEGGSIYALVMACK